MSAGRDTRQHKSQYKSSNDAALGHNPVQSRLPARWFNLGIFIPQNTVFRASHDWLLNFFYLKANTDTGLGCFTATVVIASGVETVT